MQNIRGYTKMLNHSSIQYSRGKYIVGVFSFAKSKIEKQFSSQIDLQYGLLRRCW